MDALLAYKGTIEKQLIEDCERIINITQTKVLQNSECEGTAKAFFVKMKGDYYRYISENAKGDKLEQAK